MATGGSEFNEVFFDDVFVPDDDVIGPVDGGWTVARATLGNESVSIGGGSGGGIGAPDQTMIALARRAPGPPPRRRVPRRARTSPTNQAMAMLNLRTVHRAVAGGGPGPEGNITKLVLSEQGHEATAIMSELTGPDLAFMDERRRRRRSARALAPRPCRSPAARRRSSATRSASASSASRATR